MGFTRRQEADIAAPIDEVFAYVSDVRRHPEWADQEMTVTHVSGPESGPGATFATEVTIKLPVGHQRDKATVVVTEAAAPRHLAYEATDSSGRYRWTVDLTGNGGTTHVVHAVERLDAPVWFKVAQPVLWKVIGGRMVGNGLANMKQRLESR